MPLLFLVPLALAGLAAVAVPLILHLRRREREKPMRFPSLMFLQRVTISTARRRRITDIPLLLLRCAIVALAVLAFARPVFRPRPDAKPARGTRRIVVLIDRSMSMSHLAVWRAAEDSARALINALSPGDRVAVVAFDDEASVEQPLTLDHAAALAAVSRLHPTAGGTRFGAGIRAAREVLVKEADATGGEIDVVTDLQRAGATGMTGLTLPPAVTVRAVNASPKPHSNSAVTGITVQRLAGTDSARSRLVVSTQVAAHELPMPRPVHLTLTLNGRVAATRPATLPRDGTIGVTFDPVPLPIGEARLIVSIDHDSLTADDAFSAVVPAQVTRRVIVATPPDLPADEMLYLTRALEAGNDPSIKIERRAAQAIDGSAMRDALAVFLYDVPTPGGNAGSAIAAWVHDGGGLIVAAGPRLAAHGGSAGILPATERGLVDRTADRGGLLGTAALDHPIFAPFRAGGSAPLGTARFFRYPRLIPTGDAQVVARFDDGLPALVERQEGAGRVLVTAMPLDATSSDFPLQPTYLPFLRGMVLYAAGNAAAPLARTVGDAWLLPTAARNPVIRTPSQEIVRPEGRQRADATTLTEAGFYTVYDGNPSGDPIKVIAVNPAPRESDLGAMPAGELMVGVGQDSIKATERSAASLVEAERQQRIWRLLLILAAIALLGEMVVASTGWRGTAATVVGPTSEGSGR
ncbi:MAG TPA: BatA domain-containing protein [Gemmatimonadales bacterium]|jgi:hypothetical protein